MTKLTNHQSATTTKMLLLGDSGSGKSGCLASLAAAGYKLRVVDTDNGLDVLRHVLTSSAGTYGPQAAANVEFETITDPMKQMAGRLIPVKASVWQRAVGLLDNWSPKTTSSWPEKAKLAASGGNDTAELGPLVSWTSQDVLVIDSLTTLCNAAMNFVLAMNARLGQQPHQSDWYQGQQLVESLLQMLYDENIKCNVIINCHIAYIGEDNGPQRGYPNSLGKALAPKIGRYFNTILMARTQGTGATAKRVILTQSTPMVELKNTAPLNIKPEYPLATGLAEIFKAIRGEPTASST